jgi:hypothetical protein
MITAIVKGNGVTQERVAAYLPSNFTVIDSYCEFDGLRDAAVVVIEGEDSMGWTFDDYVEPRLASGLMFATKVDDSMTEPCPHEHWRFVDHLDAFVCTSCSAVDEAQG